MGEKETVRRTILVKYLGCNIGHGSSDSSDGRYGERACMRRSLDGYHPPEETPQSVGLRFFGHALQPHHCGGVV